jgi:HD-GYP domain-containing protein (c-di-GMP phosphodiesterase class II)
MSDSPANKIKLPSSLARVGKELAVDVYASNGILLLKKGHYVLTPELRSKLLELGMGDAVEIDARLERERRERAAAREAEEASSKVNPLTELEFQARRLQNLLTHALNVPFFAEGIDEIAGTLSRQAERNPDGLIAAALLVPYKDYCSSHSLHVTALLAVLARRLNLSASEMRSLLGAALTMNIAIAHTQNQLMLAEADDNLTVKQQELLLTHPILASAILRAAGVEDELWHTLVQQHHEEWHGEGYPGGLGREDIHPLAHLLHLVDVLVTSLGQGERQQLRQPSTVLARLFKGEAGLFDPKYTTLAIKELGIYPPGSFVRLASGEIAVVTQRHGIKANEPKVAALRKVDGPPYASPLLRDTRNVAYRVQEAVPAAVANVRIGFLSKLWIV